LEEQRIYLQSYP